MQRTLLTSPLLLGYCLISGTACDGDMITFIPTQVPADMSRTSQCDPGSLAIFVSSSVVTGQELSVDTMSKADRLCENLAKQSPLYFGKNPLWIAWLSYIYPNNQPMFDAIGRVRQKELEFKRKLGPWCALNPSRDLVFQDTETLGSGAPKVSLQFDEKGEQMISDISHPTAVTAIWTGTQATGTIDSADGTCPNAFASSWSATDKYGVIGRVGGQGASWTKDGFRNGVNFGIQPCKSNAHIICLQINID